MAATGHPRGPVCIAGGGPAGLMLGFLLARAGIPVTVLEKHADFLRDFRGDTIHPSTLRLMSELGLFEAFLREPHTAIRQLAVDFGSRHITLADFTHLPAPCNRLLLMPQWDFLNFLAARASAYPHFQLRRRTWALDLIRDDTGAVTGVRLSGPDGEEELQARLVVAADGRHSTLRAAASLPVRTIGAPIDVIWFSVEQRPEDVGQTLGRIGPGYFFVTLDRGTYWQCAWVIPKGGFEAVKAEGLAAFRKRLAMIFPGGEERFAALDDWSRFSLLTVTIDRLERWSEPGFLCIGDAAHAMSPVGGVGINLAIQDAVAAANLLWQPLREGEASPEQLAAIERRRMWPVKVTQALQVQIQNRIIRPVLDGQGDPPLPLMLRLVSSIPLLQRFMARLVGLGVRSEHIGSPQLPVQEPPPTASTS